MRGFKALSLSVLLAATLSAGSAASDPPDPNIPSFPLLAPNTFGVLALWTQFVAGDTLSSANKKIEARFVLTGDTDCSKVIVMQSGAGPLKGLVRTTMTGGKDNSQYTVTICTAPLSTAATQASLTDAAGTQLTVYPTDVPAIVPGPAMLGRASGDNTRITGIALGDSGCRGDTQDCATDWTLKGLAQAAADTKPDFVLHVGDYHYFYEDDFSFWHEDGGKDRFGYWLQEFLIPAGSLLRAAPWIFARGNHERCTDQWVGNAWHALFDPADVAQQNVSCADRIPATWAVDLAPQSGQSPSFRFYIIDNAQGGTRNAQGYRDAALPHPHATGSQVGWIAHYPPLKMAHYSGKWNYTEELRDRSKPIFDDIQAAMAQAVYPCQQGKPCVPSAVFAGHQHFYQEFVFDKADGQPVIMIVGHGGVSISKTQMPGYNTHAVSTECQRDFATHSPFPQPTGAANATLRTAQVNGFLYLSRDHNTVGPSGWDRTYHWANASPAVNFPRLAGGCPHN